MQKPSSYTQWNEKYTKNFSDITITEDDAKEYAVQLALRYNVPLKDIKYSYIPLTKLDEELGIDWAEKVENELTPTHIGLKYFIKLETKTRTFTLISKLPDHVKAMYEVVLEKAFSHLWSRDEVGPYSIKQLRDTIVALMRAKQITQ